mgnify:FL=1
MFDLIIIGAGPAGMSASVYASKANLNTLLIESDTPGGLLNKINKIDNYLGFKNINGSDLAFNMYEHVRSEGIILKHEKVLGIKKENGFKVITNKNEYNTKKIIIAIGRKPIKTGIPGETEYNKKGISYCAICDSHLYKDKDVVVIGDDSLAYNEALYLNDICSTVTFITNNKDIKSDKINIVNSNVKEFIGNDILTGVVLENNETIKCSAAFIYKGYMTEVSFLKDLNIINDKGNIDVDDRYEAHEKGIYAVGDIINKKVYQIATAVSDGCNAALNVKMDITNEK